MPFLKRRGILERRLVPYEVAGPAGSTGPIGPTGPSGSGGAGGGTGATGATGSTGSAGSTGVSSSLAEENATGTVNGINTVFTVVNLPIFVAVSNQLYINGDGYTRTGTGPYTLTFDVAPFATPHSFYKDPIGTAGASGATGATGATGAGATGAQGATGANGATGATGAGATGATGAGTAGATGATGAAGSSSFSVPSSNSFNGITISLTAGENLFRNDVCRINSIGRVVKARADNLLDSAAIVINTAAVTTGNLGTFLIFGLIDDSTWNWTNGSILYLSNTAGSMSHSVVSGSGSISQVLGLSLGSTTAIFKAELVEVERV